MLLIGFFQTMAWWHGDDGARTFSYQVSIVHSALENRDREEKIKQYFKLAIVAGWVEFYKQPIVKKKFLIKMNFMKQLGDQYEIDLNLTEDTKVVLAMVSKPGEGVGDDLVLTLQARMIDLDPPNNAPYSLQDQAAFR